MNEFFLIEKYLAPLAKDFPGSLNLTDDAACIDVPSGKQLIITKDAISSAIHFLGNESPDLIARKLLRVNLSDLAAKGATPLCYFVAACLPENTDEQWIVNFTEGLKKDQEEFDIHLAGGDTTRTQGKVSLSLTALGLIDEGKMLKRSGAQVGDDIYVSGTLGESALGLMYLQKKQIGGQQIDSALSTLHGTSSKRVPEAIKNESQQVLAQAYLLPKPRITLGQKLIGIAHACMDVSDGLMQDVEHICKASKVGAVIEKTKLPLPGTDNWQELISGGDDYELLFTAPPSQEENIKQISRELQLPITHIGKITEGNSAILIDEREKEIALTKKGYSHF